MMRVLFPLETTAMPNQAKKVWVVTCYRRFCELDSDMVIGVCSSPEEVIKHFGDYAATSDTSDTFQATCFIMDSGDMIPSETFMLPIVAETYNQEEA